ncbi:MULTISPECIES: DUF6777 domain-containing protein [unclassified Streptomyces]|uniref:DUF6777 domain-containing protein n=1 Tax=unclassified Streptomyces TaxID=2593676 RepID=UPI00225869CC|nr:MULTISPECIES: DUF6777 domain-containing protein [unclassified Streptomyces]MCX4529444.1 hypothetical protein [Streptomyces sp. NBC_01551]MCX4540006.1 hypothetical protein [Streptomyces sp. NBC_01565]
MHAPTPPTPRQAPRRHAPAHTALFTLVGLLAAACAGPEDSGGTKGAGAESQEVHLQPVASAGPDPFTASSATRESAPVQPPLPNPTGQGIRTVNAATPGLYGGTQRLGSCDVEQQLRFFSEDSAKARAFAEAADVEEEKIPDFLRGLTPVVLRADTRVTNHGFRDGRPAGFQSVLQAGTAVLVDGHGMPRVRCACGNPLLAPRAAKGSPVYKGDAWNGYQPNQVVVIEPTIQTIENLVIVNIANNTWIERKSGDDGARDRIPQAPPAYDPADGIPEGAATSPSDPSGRTRPCAPPAGNGLERTAPPSGPASGSGVPGPEPTDCPPSPSSPTSPTGRPPGTRDLPDTPNDPNAPNNPNNPNNPNTPSTPSTPNLPDGPGAAPADPSVPTQPVPDWTPPNDVPPDLAPPQDPGDPGLQQAPDGSMTVPPDPYDPAYPFDPFTVPEQDPAATDPGVYLESA